MMRHMEITDVIEEAEGVKTFRLAGGMDASPGQFVMVWVPGRDEFPMSLSGIFRDAITITVKAIGPGTEGLHAMSAGAILGIRGPYGQGYSLHEKTDGPLLLLGGGTGTASLMAYARHLAAMGREFHVALGAKTEGELFFTDEMEKLAAGLHIATDDGSRGHAGFVTELLDDIVEAHGITGIAACGPEPMMVRAFEAARRAGIAYQASLERYMKCGVGICDICSFGPYRVCKDGPVFDDTVLASVEDFGRWKRAPSGRKIRM